MTLGHDSLNVCSEAEDKLRKFDSTDWVSKIVRSQRRVCTRLVSIRESNCRLLKNPVSGGNESGEPDALEPQGRDTLCQANPAPRGPRTLFLIG